MLCMMVAAEVMVAADMSPLVITDWGRRFVRLDIRGLLGRPRGPPGMVYNRPEWKAFEDHICKTLIGLNYYEITKVFPNSADKENMS